MVWHSSLRPRSWSLLAGSRASTASTRASRLMTWASRMAWPFGSIIVEGIRRHYNERRIAYLMQRFAPLTFDFASGVPEHLKKMKFSSSEVDLIKSLPTPGTLKSWLELGRKKPRSCAPSTPWSRYGSSNHYRPRAKAAIQAMGSRTSGNITTPKNASTIDGPNGIAWAGGSHSSSSSLTTEVSASCR